MSAFTGIASHEGVFRGARSKSVVPKNISTSPIKNDANFRTLIYSVIWFREVSDKT